MIIAVAVGATTGDAIPNAFDTVRLKGVSLPIVVGLIVMMVPPLAKVQYEQLPVIFGTRKVWFHLGISLVLNWVVGPFVMLACAWAALPDLPTYRSGVILVGIARCIAMVMIWNGLAGGDHNYCAILVAFNSLIQIVLYAPYALFLINVIGGSDDLKIDYGTVAIQVLIYLGIPLVAGVVVRYSVWALKGKQWLESRFMPWFAPLALVGLLYTIFVIFAYKGNDIIDNIGDVFRVVVPLLMYFVAMWFAAFFFMFWLSLKNKKYFSYEMAVVQSFTAGSNNFELAIAIAIGTYGISSDQALAATIGPLVEVPVLLALTYVSLLLKRKLGWPDQSDEEAELRLEQNQKAENVPQA